MFSLVFSCFGSVGVVMISFIVDLIGLISVFVGFGLIDG